MLQQNDIDGLLAALNASQESGVSHGERMFSEVKIYDFARPDNLPSEFTRALENINASFARALSGILTGYLSMGVQVDTLSIDQMAYRQFCNSVPEITAMCTFTISPLEGSALLELNPHLAWYLIDRGLGGQGEVIESPREFTSLEKGLLDDLFRRILRELGRAWGTLCPLNPSLREVSSNPMITRIAQPDDRMVVCSFGISMPGVTGVSTYCIPVSSLDFERLLNSENAWNVMTEDPMLVDMELVEENTGIIRLPVRACLPDISITLGELSSLSVGDVVDLGMHVDQPVEIRAANKICFLANPVTKNDSVAVEIIDDFTEVTNG